jgi:hypothetical protein
MQAKGPGILTMNSVTTLMTSHNTAGRLWVDRVDDPLVTVSVLHNQVIALQTKHTRNGKVDLLAVAEDPDYVRSSNPNPDPNLTLRQWVKIMYVPLPLGTVSSCAYVAS